MSPNVLPHLPFGETFKLAEGEATDAEVTCVEDKQLRVGVATERMVLATLLIFEEAVPVHLPNFDWQPVAQ